MSDQLIKEMFASAVHIGHRTYKWNPRMEKYLYGEQNGLHILNLEKTAENLKLAVEFMKGLYREGKTILFVSTKPQSLALLESTAKSLNMPYVVSKWIPGLLTNFSTIKTRIKYLLDLKKQEADGEFDKYTKKEVAKLKKIVNKLETALGGVVDLKKAPDAVFVLDVHRDNIPVLEAMTCKVPIVAFLDSNSDPKGINFPIPANDDAISALTYMLDYIVAELKGAKK